MFKNTAAKFVVFAWNVTTGLPVSGDAANLTAYVSKDYGTVTVLADTSATEMDSTNAKGYYLFDAAQGETNGDVLLVTCKSATANIAVIGAPAVVYTRPTTGWLAPATAGRTLVVDDSGLADANAVKVGPTGSGTAQTARDIGASVLLSSGTGAGQLDFTSGVVKANATQWLGGTIPAVNVTGVPLVDAKYLLGTVFATPATAGIPDVNVKNIDNDAASASGTVTFPNATLASTTNITAGTIATVTNVTNLHASAATAANLATVAGYLDTEIADIQARLPAALTAGGNIKADALAFSGDTIAADNAEAFFDGTGYAGTNNVIPTVTTLTNDPTGVTTALSRLTATRAGYLDNLSAGAVATQAQLLTVTDYVDTEIAAILTHLTDIKGATFSGSTDSLEAIRDRGDAAWITATGFSTHSAADVWAAGTRTLTAGTNINGSTFTAVPWNASWDAEVQSECEDALAAVGVTTTVTGRIDAAVTSRMVSYTQPAGFLAATFPVAVASTTNITAGVITTVTTVTNQLTAAQIATGVWQDATAGDFTTANSVGKSLYNAFTAGTSVYTAASMVNAPSGGTTAAAIADAVWDEVTSGHTTSGTFGYSLNTAAAKIIAAGTSITAVTIPTPVTENFELEAGIDYSSDDGDAISFNVVTSWNLATALSVTQIIYENTEEGSGVYLSLAMTVTPMDGGYVLSRNYSAAQTTALLTTPKRRHAIQTVLANGNTKPLIAGILTITS